MLLKGATTLVVDAGTAGPVRSQADAPAWLATAGSGDVLAGLAGTLLAAGLTPLDAGSVAALVHGLAGDARQPRRPGAGAGSWRTPYRRSWRGSWRAGAQPILRDWGR